MSSDPSESKLRNALGGGASVSDSSSSIEDHRVRTSNQDCFRASLRCFQSSVKADRSLLTGAIVDTACTSDLAGTTWCTEYCTALRKLGVKFELKKIGPGVHYDFGGDNSSGTLGRYCLPAWPFGRPIQLRFYLISGNTPYLFSLPSIEKLGLDILGSTEEFAVEGTTWKYSKTSCGHLVVPLLPKCEALQNMTQFCSLKPLKCFMAGSSSPCVGPEGSSVTPVCSSVPEGLKPDLCQGVSSLIRRDPLIQRVKRRKRLDISFSLGLTVCSEERYISRDDLVECNSNGSREVLLSKLKEISEEVVGFSADCFTIGYKCKFFTISEFAVESAVLSFSSIDNSFRIFRGIDISKGSFDLESSPDSKDYKVHILFQRFVFVSKKCMHESS